MVAQGEGGSIVLLSSHAVPGLPAPGSARSPRRKRRWSGWCAISPTRSACTASRGNAVRPLGVDPAAAAGGNPHLSRLVEHDGAATVERDAPVPAPRRDGRRDRLPVEPRRLVRQRHVRRRRRRRTLVIAPPQVGQYSSCRRRLYSLPADVRGSLVAELDRAGHLELRQARAQWARSASWVASSADPPGARTTSAFTCSPQSGSGTPNTATSADER